MMLKTHGKPAAAARVKRREAGKWFRADFEFKGMMRAEVEQRIEESVTDLASAKTALKRLAVVVLYLAKHLDLD